jgi:hypothetical protein
MSDAKYLEAFVKLATDPSHDAVAEMDIGWVEAGRAGIRRVPGAESKPMASVDSRRVQRVNPLWRQTREWAAGGRCLHELDGQRPESFFNEAVPAAPN